MTSKRFSTGRWKNPPKNFLCADSDGATSRKRRELNLKERAKWRKLINIWGSIGRTRLSCLAVSWLCVRVVVVVVSLRMGKKYILINHKTEQALQDEIKKSQLD